MTDDEKRLLDVLTRSIPKEYFETLRTDPAAFAVARRMSSSPAAIAGLVWYMVQHPDLKEYAAGFVANLFVFEQHMGTASGMGQALSSLVDLQALRTAEQAQNN